MKTITIGFRILIFLILFVTINFCHAQKIILQQTDTIFQELKYPNRSIGGYGMMDGLFLKDVDFHEAKFSDESGFIYTVIIFFTLTLRIENIKFRYVWETVYLFFVFTTGIICLAYFANFIIQK